MTKLDPGGVAALARGAGFTGEAQRIAVAVSFAENESHETAEMGDTTITNGTWGPSVGLWQIRSLKADKGTGRTRDETKLTDPGFNARSAFTISNGGRTWGPWTMYANGRYKAKLAAADEAIQADKDGIPAEQIRETIGNTVGGVTSGLDVGGRITASVNALTGNLFKAGLNIGAVLLALLLLGLGVAILLHRPIKQATLGVAKAAGAVAPQGRVATVAGKAAKVMPG